MGDFVILTRPNTHQHIGSPTAQGVSSRLRVGRSQNLGRYPGFVGWEGHPTV